MVNSLQGNNVEQKMIGGARPARPAQAPRPRPGDTFVANIAEKRYLWTARAFAIITAISICCNIVLILAIIQVMPLFRVEPFLLSFQNKSEQVYNIVPLQNLEDEKSITEIFVRQYVLLRSSFNRNIPEMEARWMPGGPIQEMSSPAVYEDFQKKTALKALQVIRSKSLTRSVKIISVNELTRGLWQVEYETRDMYPDSSKPEINYWTASLRIMYRGKSVKYGERLKNPVGFTVVRYSLTFNKVQ
mgnify:CR=1 FL=1